MKYLRGRLSDGTAILAWLLACALGGSCAGRDGPLDSSSGYVHAVPYDGPYGLATGGVRTSEGWARSLVAEVSRGRQLTLRLLDDRSDQTTLVAHLTGSGPWQIPLAKVEVVSSTGSPATASLSGQLRVRAGTARKYVASGSFVLAEPSGSSHGPWRVNSIDWEFVEVPVGEYFATAFATGKRGWTVGWVDGDAAGCDPDTRCGHTVVLGTEDGGASFVEVATLEGFAHTVAVGDVNAIWVAADSGLYLGTAAGTVWEQARTGAWDIVRADGRDSVWAAGPERLLRSEDGGLTWKTAGVHMIEVRPVGEAVLFGLEVVDERQVYISKSDDGGASWQQQRQVSDLSANAAARALCFTDARHGWYGQEADGDEPPALLQTKDGSEWAAVDLEFALFALIGCGSGGRLWAEASRLEGAPPGPSEKSVWASADGGQSWSSLAQPFIYLTDLDGETYLREASHLHEVVLTPEGIAIGVGRDGVVLREVTDRDYPHFDGAGVRGQPSLDF